MEPNRRVGQDCLAESVQGPASGRDFLPRLRLHPLHEAAHNFAEKAREFADAGIDVVAISTDLPDDLRDQVRAYEKKGGFPFQLVSNAKLDVFEAYGCLDSNRKPLHGTFLIDAQGRIHWQNIGVKPFEDPTFVLNEAKKLLSLASVRESEFRL